MLFDYINIVILCKFFNKNGRNILKKIIVLLLLNIVFSFAQEISDTIQVEKTDDLTADSAIILDETTEVTETLEKETNVTDTTDTIENVIKTEETDTTTTENENTEIIPDSISILTIITTPDNASVLINRKRVGNSPVSAQEFVPAEYNVMILKDGFDVFDTTLTLVGGKAEELSITLVSENAEQIVVEDTNDSTEIANADSTSDTTAVSSNDKTKKKKKVDRIGIIIFLSLMFALLFAQEYNNR